MPEPFRCVFYVSSENERVMIYDIYDIYDTAELTEHSSKTIYICKVYGRRNFYYLQFLCLKTVLFSKLALTIQQQNIFFYSLSKIMLQLEKRLKLLDDKYPSHRHYLIRSRPRGEFKIKLQ